MLRSSSSGASEVAHNAYFFELLSKLDEMADIVLTFVLVLLFIVMCVVFKAGKKTAGCGGLSHRVLCSLVSRLPNTNSSLWRCLTSILLADPIYVQLFHSWRQGSSLNSGSPPAPATQAWAVTGILSRCSIDRCKAHWPTSHSVE